MSEVICGSGATCEKVCPIKSPGRICPTFEESAVVVYSLLLQRGGVVEGVHRPSLGVGVD